MDKISLPTPPAKVSLPDPIAVALASVKSMVVHGRNAKEHELELLNKILGIVKVTDPELVAQYVAATEVLATAMNASEDIVDILSGEKSPD
ncbi:MAG: hypothetical protein KJ887_07285 [Candidatus Omnitrophica bacterium]|nr:hypothetical protein [Candidatus Omnitrophota bacterium]MBU1048359.1 hypothetical protein [Candidatus Omnitrophota bacterium]MBU1767847.1 hypothetical protein [Candidatus Omnitrophota bacterium]